MPEQKQDFKQKKKPKFILMLFIIVAGALALYAYNTLMNKPKPVITDEAKLKDDILKEEQIISVVAYKVAKSDFVDTFPSMGTVKGIREVNLKFDSSGIIEAINFKEGDMVKNGDVIATLSLKEAQLNIEYNKSKLKTAQSEMQAAKKKLEVYQKLYEAGSIIKAKLDEVSQEYEVMKSKVETAKLEIEHAENEIEKKSLFAPMDGVLTSKEAEVGELVNPNAKIATLIDVSLVYVEIGITEKDIERIKLGQKVKVNIDTYPGRDFFGGVDKIFPQIEGRSRTMTVKIKLENEEMVLKPGMFARVNINVYEKKDALLVPVGVIKKNEEEGSYFVFVVKKEEGKKDMVELRPIKLGYRTIEYAMAEEGLSEGELVVTESQGELKDKALCEVLEIQEPAQEQGKQEEQEI